MSSPSLVAPRHVLAGQSTGWTAAVGRRGSSAPRAFLPHRPHRNIPRASRLATVVANAGGGGAQTSATATPPPPETMGIEGDRSCFACPICSGAMTRVALGGGVGGGSTALKCAANHSFDVAKEGHVNLLTRTFGMAR